MDHGSYLLQSLMLRQLAQCRHAGAPVEGACIYNVFWCMWQTEQCRVDPGYEGATGGMHAAPSLQYAVAMLLTELYKAILRLYTVHLSCQVPHTKLPFLAYLCLC